MQKRTICFFFLSIILISALLQSCRDDDVFSGTEIDLVFSEDTLRFDTVFTSLGSATRFIKIFNPESSTIQINSISLRNGSGSFFNINVNGKNGKSVNDIRVAANDSIYVFAEVTIDPDMPLSVSPFIIEEQCIVDVNGIEQVFYLEAWGQNANYIPDRYAEDTISVLTEFYPCTGGEIVWDDPKPYVIYGILYVDNCNLKVAAGTRIYVHGGISINSLGIYNDGLITIGPNGSLNCQGTLTDSIIIQGDRLEPSFQDNAGQWAGIRILPLSQNNSLNHTIIKNSIVGIRVDSLAHLEMNNSKIFNTSNSGLIGVHANIDANNSLFYNNGGFGIQCSFGGNYNFNYCTVASFGNETEALRLDNFLCVDPLCLELPLYNPLSANFKNCIIVGSQIDELSFFDLLGGEPGAFDFNFEYCIVKVDTLLAADNYPNFLLDCPGCIEFENSNMDTLFVSVNADNYRLDSLSIAEEMGIPLINIPLDIEGNIRDMSSPDIGCYEYQ